MASLRSAKLIGKLDLGLADYKELVIQTGLPDTHGMLIKRIEANLDRSAFPSVTGNQYFEMSFVTKHDTLLGNQGIDDYDKPFTICKFGKQICSSGGTGAIVTQNEFSWESPPGLLVASKNIYLLATNFLENVVTIYFRIFYAKTPLSATEILQLKAER